jgi:tetratricopeptide (TPR) repeat protein
VAAAGIGAAAGLALGLAGGWLSARAPRGLAHVRWSSRAPGPGTGRAPAKDSDVVPVAGPPGARLRTLDRALAAMHPDDHSRPAALLARARVFLESAESPTLALADIERLLVKHPLAHEAAEALYLRAAALADAGARPAAIEAAMKFLSAFPSSWRAPDAAVLAADLLEAGGRTADAEDILRDVLVRDPDRDREARAHLDVGERGRYTARAERLLMRLGRLALASGDFAAAEGAYELVAEPTLCDEDFGETFAESGFLAAARVGMAEAGLRMGGRREAPSREALARLAERYAGTPAGRRAALTAGLLERASGERALALAEAGRLAEVAPAVWNWAQQGDSALEFAAVLEARAFLDPSGVISVICAMGGHDVPDTSPRVLETLAIADAFALEARGRAAGADAALAGRTSERLALVRAELARRRGDGDTVRAALARGAHLSDLAAALLERDGARGEASP